MVHAKRTSFQTKGGSRCHGLDRSTDPLGKGLDGELDLFKIGEESPFGWARKQGNSLDAIDLHHRHAQGPSHPATCRMANWMGIQGVGQTSD